MLEVSVRDVKCSLSNDEKFQSRYVFPAIEKWEGRDLITAIDDRHRNRALSGIIKVNAFIFPNN